MEQNVFLKYYQYSKERFPLKNFIPLSAIFAASAGIATQAYLYGRTKDIQSLFLAFFALLLFFLRLRLFDEFKDFKHDSQYYPTRPVPRGLITLKELNRIIFVVLCLEILIGASRGLKSLILFFAALIYSLLMFKEFFVSDWLRKHFTIYIVSHEALILPLFFYIFSLNGLQVYNIGQIYFWFLTIFLGAQLFLLEVVRKTRPKELEIASGDTYTAKYGVKGAALLVIFLGLFTVLFGAFTGKMLYGKNTFLDCMSLIILFGLLFSVLRFVKSPTEATAKKVFSISIIFVLIANLLFIINILTMS